LLKQRPRERWEIHRYSSAFSTWQFLPSYNLDSPPLTAEKGYLTAGYSEGWAAFHDPFHAWLIKVELNPGL
jgi:hypothetical protein